MTATANRPIKKGKHLTILQRVAGKDQTAVQDCLDTYGEFIWALAKKFTASTAEAEIAAQEIFADIWRYAERADQTRTAEETLISLIARRRLIKRLR